MKDIERIGHGYAGKVHDLTIGMMRVAARAILGGSLCQASAHGIKKSSGEMNQAGIEIILWES
jgi:hypothetical protein